MSIGSHHHNLNNSISSQSFNLSNSQPEIDLYPQYFGKKVLNLEDDFVKNFFKSTVDVILEHDSLPLKPGSLKLLNSKVAIFLRRQNVTELKKWYQGCNNLFFKLVQLFPRLKDPRAGDYRHLKNKFTTYFQRQRKKARKNGNLSFLPQEDLPNIYLNPIPDHM